MQAIILAAGQGTRLGSLTKDTPKALIEVASKTLIAHTIKFAKQAQINRRIVVGGYYYDQLAQAVTQIDPFAILVENKNLLAGNLLSLIAGLSALTADDGFLLMNTDHIYPKAIADIVATVVKNADRITAFCDFDRSLGPDDMKVKLRDGFVIDMSKKLANWDAGYVGMTYVPECYRSTYEKAANNTRQSLGDNVAVENILVNLASSNEHVAIADVSGHRWFEIDEPQEKDRADRKLFD